MLSKNVFGNLLMFSGIYRPLSGARPFTTASSRVAFIEYPWTYADCAQCEDRAHRIGQKNNVICAYFLGQETIDQYMYNMIQNKRHIGNTITGATDNMEMTFIDNVIDILK